MSNNVLSLFVLFFLMYLIMTGYFFFGQSRLLYFPSPDIITTPGQIGLAYEDISFTATDGTHLSGWFIPAENNKTTILVCHGNAGNISDRLETIEFFNRLGYAVFIFDYRGYGHSEGSPSERGTYLDAQAAWDFLMNTKQMTPESIILFGRSLGGAIAARTAVANQPKACILESSFISVPELATDLYPFLPAKLLCRFDYNTLAAVAKISSPLLITHSKDDEIVPFSHGQRLFQAAREPKTLLTIHGGHNTGFVQSAPQYQKGLQQFLRNL